MDAYVSPISHAQRRLWFLDRLEPGNAIYHMPVAVRLRGVLQPAALHQALQTIVERHDALRTTFAIEDGEPVQVVHDAVTLELATEEVADEAALHSRLRDEARLPFDLARGPLLRARLFRRAEQDHVLLLTLHHIIADGWSLGVLVDEFSALYRAAADGAAHALPELPIQFADFTDWQNETLEGEAATRELAEWQRHLAGAPTVLELPADHPRPDAQSYRGALLLRTLPPQLAAAAQALSRREGVTLFMTLLAAFQTLLSRWSRQEEWLLGTPVAGRTRSETERLIGFFVNTLVLRVDLGGGPSFSTLLARTKAECLAAFGRQDTPFDRVVDAVQPARDRARTPLFQVYFTLQNAPRRELALPGLTAEVIEVDTGTAKVNLTLALEESPAGLAARWEYCTDVFAPATIERMAQSYETLLGALVAHPQLPVTQAPLLTPIERRAVLALGQGSTPDFSTDLSLGRWFAQQARSTPDRVAITGENASLTYAQLEARSNQLGRRLRSAGVTPGARVGLCLNRSLDLIVGILGILKAGAAYVPLDPTYPRDRLDFLVRDSGLAALVTRDAVGGIEHPVRIDLALQAGDIAAEDAAPFDDRVGAADAAYIIYTSGSTGQPKGCVVTHGNVTRLMRATEHWFGFAATDVWTLFHSYAFDFSVWEIWGALLYGGRLVVVPYDVSRNPAAFLELLAAEQVTVLNQTPSAFRQLIAVDGERPDLTLALRYVIFGGEALELSMLQPWFDRHGDDAPQVINMYGITETTVHVTYRRIRLADVAARRGSVIGQRIPDLTLHVVDEHLEPRPIGVPGELLVGGAGLALGYHQRPELTAERFITNPFGSGRLYRSGDLARWLPDGDLEYLGRIDQQVKIRGFRIEPGEIERVVAALTGVRDCAVVAREDKVGEKKLVAYVVRQPGSAEPDARTAREACRSRLADYMVPAAFVFLERLPLTAHGKLDRRALPVPDLTEAATAEYSAPESPAEKTLAAIWARVLGVPAVGTRDNFFALGGDSILTIQVVSLAAKAGLKLTPKDLFEAQTLAELARAARPVGPAAPAAAPMASAAAANDSYPLTPMQAGMLFQSVLEPEAGVYFEQVWGELRGELNVPAFRAAWQGLLDRHPGLRTRFEWREVPEPRQSVAPAALLPWRELDWSGAKAPQDATAAWEDLLARDRTEGFIFDQAPLMRVTLVRVGSHQWRWLWSHHHLLLDGWCLPLVFQDVLGDYEHRLGHNPAPPGPGLPYRAYVDWVLAQDLRAAEHFWRGYLAGFAGAPELKLPAPDQPGPLAGELSLQWSAEESSSLRTWTRRHGLTLNTLFQGAWALLLHRYGAGEDIVFGVTVAGRPAELPGVERIIGLFINTLPLRVRIPAAASPSAWLRELQLAQAELREFEHSPLASVQGWSEVPRGRPLFESILVFENYPGDDAVRALRSSVQLEGLHTREQTNYPLTLAVLPGDAITLKLHYDGRRFARAAMERTLRHWQQLVRELAAADARPLGRITPLTLAELDQIRTWNAARASFGSATTVLDLVAAWAENSPSAPALLGPDRTVSYLALHRHAGGLAERLQRLGVGRGDRVAVCCEKTPALVLAMLGILRAGAAFVPLDPRFARERLAFLVADAQPAALIVHAPTSWVADLARVPVLTLEDDAFAGDATGAPVPTPLSADDLAYVIHTSGSTGRPKGVMLTHGGLVNLAQAQAAATALGPGQRVLQFASISFDAAVSEIFMALAAGAAVWLEPRDDVPDPREFAARLRRAQIDHATLPPALLNALDPAEFPGLRTLLVAGEAASETLYRTWARGRRLFNAYGPTEITVCATMEEISAATDTVTLGRPLANLTVHILDTHLSPCPIGVAGEICVGGLGVGRGYLGRPELTAERFIPDPFASLPGARLYRTGDLGRWRADGRVEFLGRSDHQVKIRGFRVEPGEVEAVLQQHPAVGGALVLACGEAAGRHLVAYWVPRSASAAARPAELREFLASHLPDYLVPRHLVGLPAWPLTSAGKIDRQALPPSSADEAGPGDRASAPLAGEIEETLARIWRDVLRAPAVGPDDNFFELGGDSILSLQIVARAHQAGYTLTPRQIFSSPTVRGLAALATPVAARDTLEDEQGELPLTPIQHWFFQQNQPEAHHWNQSVVLELRHPITREQLSHALAAVVACHGAFRLRFPTDDSGARRQVYAPLSEAALTLPEYPLAALTEVASRLQTGFDLVKGPLWCAAVFVHPDGKPAQLFLALHHLIVDGVSWRILAGDLAQACAQIVSGRQPALAPVATSFGGWARSLRERAQTAALRDELHHWRQLGDSAGTLPRDFPNDPAAAGVETMETLNVELDEHATASLLRDAAAAYRLRADEVLLAALAATLAEWTGRASTLVSLENHGREDLGDALDLSRTVGWFTSLFPLRLDCAPGTDAAALLTATKEALRRTPRHGVGFGVLGHLCEDAAVRREIASLPQPEICFNYLGQVDHTLGADSPFGWIDAATGPGSSPRGHRAHLVDLNAIVVGGRLRFSWIYGSRAHRRATIERQAEALLGHVRALLAHCTSPGAGTPTPSDFTHVRLDANELDALLEDLADPQPS